MNIEYLIEVPSRIAKVIWDQAIDDNPRFSTYEMFDHRMDEELLIFHATSNKLSAVSFGFFQDIPLIFSHGTNDRYPDHAITVQFDFAINIITLATKKGEYKVLTEAAERQIIQDIQSIINVIHAPQESLDTPPNTRIYDIDNPYGDTKPKWVADIQVSQIGWGLPADADVLSRTAQWRIGTIALTGTLEIRT